MGRIKNKSRYPDDTVVSSNDYIIGSDGDNNGRTKNFPVDSLAEYIQTYISENVEGIEQDNQAKIIRTSTSAPHDRNTVANRLNSIASFTIGEKEVPFILVGKKERPSLTLDILQQRRYVYVYVLKGLGKGTYGTGGTTISASNLGLISTILINDEFILDSDETQIIELGDIGSSTVSEGVNALDPCVLIQEQADGYVVVTATIDGTYYEYLYLADGGSFGGACSQTQEGDFILLSDFTNVTEITNTSQLVNDGEDGTAPYITFTDLYTGNSIINYGAGIRYLQDFDFYVWINSYIINNVVYISPSDFVDGNVTLSDAHATLNRTDVFYGCINTEGKGVITLTGGSSGSITSVQADGEEILGATVPFDTDLQTTAINLAQAINEAAAADDLKYYATATNGVVTVVSTSGSDPNGNLLTVTGTGITYTTTNFSGFIDGTPSVGVKTGINASSPYAPILNPITQVAITTIDVLAGATDFSQITYEAIYDENLGTPDEWEIINPHVGFESDDSSEASNGSVSITYFSAIFGIPIIFQNEVSPMDFDTIGGSLQMDIKIDSPISNNFLMYVRIRNYGVSSADSMLVLNLTDLEARGFAWPESSGEWVRISINHAEFAGYSDEQFNQLLIGFDNCPDIDIDNIGCQYGLGVFDPIFTPTLQQVTNVGAKTTNPITIDLENNSSSNGVSVITTEGASAKLGIQVDGTDTSGAIELTNENEYVGKIFLEPSQTALVNNYVLPIRGAGSETILAVGATDGSTTALAGADGIIDISGLVSEYIPLGGTEAGSPVTGDIVYEGYDLWALRYQEPYTTSYMGIWLDDGNMFFKHVSDDYESVFGFGGENIDSYSINSDNPSFKGLIGGSYFGANYDDNTYVQKKYVDDKKYSEIIGNGSDTTITINHGLNSLNIASVYIYDISTGIRHFPTERVVDADNLELTFSVAPTINQFNATISI